MKTASVKTLRRLPIVPRAWLQAFRALPPRYTHDGQGDAAPAPVKFFDPCGSWSWFASEAMAITADDREISIAEALASNASIVDVEFFGLVSGHASELGYWTLRDLASVDGRLGIGIERDIHWTSRPLAEAGRAA